MAKKNLGKFVALAAVTGAVAAGISYFMKYKSFNKELDEEFHDFEGELDDEEFDGTLPHEEETAERNYVTLGEKKAEPAEELVESVEEAGETVEETAPIAEEAVQENVETAEETTIEEDSAQ